VEQDTDAQGVEVVTVTRSPGDYGAVAFVGDAPDLELSSMTGDPVDFFGAVRAVRRLPDGALLVADGQKGTIGIFSADGDPVSTMGGQGEVPGLFRTLSHVPLVNEDSIWVWDQQASRLTVFERDGAVARATRLSPPAGDITFQRAFVFSDRTLMGAADGRIANPPPRSDPGHILQRDSIHLVRYTQTGGLVGPLLSFLGPESLRVWQAPEPNVVMSLVAPLPFRRNASFAVLGDRIVGGANDRFEIRWWNADGQLERITRFTSYDEPIPPAAVAELRERWLEEAGSSPQRIELVELAFDEAPVPEVLPAFSAIMAGTDGRVWVREHDLHVEGSPRWWAFDPDRGIPIGWLELLPDLEVHEIGPDYVLGVYRDVTGLPSVRRYPLRAAGQE
jgi:hypothetical protein